MVCNCSKAVWKFILNLDNCDISDNVAIVVVVIADRKKTWMQYFTTYCISNGHDLEFGGPWVCVVSLALVPINILNFSILFLNDKFLKGFYDYTFV